MTEQSEMDEGKCGVFFKHHFYHIMGINLSQKKVTDFFFFFFLLYFFS